MDYLASTLLIGAGATAVTDAWSVLRQRLFGMPLPNYGMVGRWVGHMPRGTFRHDSMAAAAPVRGERLIGWAVHYLTGITFAGILTGIWGMAWVQSPSPGPALVVGIGTVAAPFLLMQPGMGAGLAARRTPRPGSARLQSLVTHAVFGLGLYIAGLAASVLAAY